MTSNHTPKKKIHPAALKPHIRIHHSFRVAFWFFLGAAIGLFFFLSFTAIYYRHIYRERIYPGVYINGIEFSKKTPEDVMAYYGEKNKMLQQSSFTLKSDLSIATISAEEIKFGYDEKLLTEQAYSIGRSGSFFSDMSMMLQTYLHGINLQETIHYDDTALKQYIDPLKETLYIEPVEARFTFENGRVTQFQPSTDGQELDTTALKQQLINQGQTIITKQKPQHIVLQVPIKVLKPQKTTDQVNNLGIRELIASGTSLFKGSIQNRAYNINLAALRIHGVLIPPGEIFSFNKTVGNISTLTGYKQAYVIQNGRTILGDGGGVCQVSTTLFRAALNAGLPIIERNPHAYRVGYYEQDSPPGIDAAIYEPTVDFTFKNDTGNHILIQTVIDQQESRLTFLLYGTKDGREVTINKPIITSLTSSPEPLYIDDPTLPKGEIKQIEHAVGGATVYFTRQVTKNGETIADDKFSSYYRAWQAVYQRGTKE